MNGNNIPKFTGKAAEYLNKYYSGLKVENAESNIKIAALQSNLGQYEFHAYGKSETEEMTLRALERVFLLQNGVDL